jgi:hypothetical protein
LLWTTNNLSLFYFVFRDRFAVNKLKTSYSEHEYYILKQDIYRKDKYAIIYSKESQIKIKCINKENGKFFLDDDRNSSFDSLTLLLKSLSGTGNTLPPNPFRVRPKSGMFHQILSELDLNQVCSTESFQS